MSERSDERERDREGRELEFVRRALTQPGTVTDTDYKTICNNADIIMLLAVNRLGMTREDVAVKMVNLRIALGRAHDHYEAKLPVEIEELAQKTKDAVQPSLFVDSGTAQGGLSNNGPESEIAGPQAPSKS